MPKEKKKEDEKLKEATNEADKKYPKKKGKIEEHHKRPKYLGGDKDGETVPLPASYHQEITNEFRKEWGYGKEKPSEEEVEEIMNKVYEKYPLPTNSVPAGGITPIDNNNIIQKISNVTGLTGTALLIYIVVSEGTRLFPPRNLVPIP